MNLKGSQTEKNLLQAFAGESMARNKYEFFAKIAKKEGYELIASVFADTAQQEQSHAKRFYRLIDPGTKIITELAAGVPGLNSTLKNLEDAIQDELEESKEMYPLYGSVADEEGFKKIGAIFRLIASVEEVHARRFKKLHNALINKTLFEDAERTEWLCRKCGYIHKGKTPPEVCPACLHPKGYFERFYMNY
jgi:rubrerythrin